MTSPAMSGRTKPLALAVTGALWLSGCVSPYVGCVIPGSTYEPNGPPAAWVQRNVPISPSPVEYAQRMEMAPPAFGAPGAPGGPVMELGTPSEASPGPIQAPAPMEWQPTQYVPPGPQV